MSINQHCWRLLQIAHPDSFNQSKSVQKAICSFSQAFIALSLRLSSSRSLGTFWRCSLICPLVSISRSPMRRLWKTYCLFCFCWATTACQIWISKCADQREPLEKKEAVCFDSGCSDLQLYNHWIETANLEHNSDHPQQMLSKSAIRIHFLSFSRRVWIWEWCGFRVN